MLESEKDIKYKLKLKRIREWQLLNVEKRRKTTREWARRNRDKRRVYEKKNRSIDNERKKLWRLNNPEKFRARKRNYYNKNKEVWLEYNHIRRARIRNCKSMDSREIISWMKGWRSLDFVQCHWCKNIFPPKQCESDHVTSLAKGGNHCLSNLVISCRHCNRTKWTKSKEEFLSPSTPTP